jgi:hypothetical protein
VAANTVSAPAPRRRRDRTHWLYLAVIGAVVLGIGVGLAFPEFATNLKWLGTAFVGLIKMLIAPVIFCTIVLGIGSIRSASKVGRVGGLALVYFLLMSTVALAIGLVVGNLLHPGDGLQLSESVRGQGSDLAATAEGGGGTIDFILGLIPTTLLSSLTEGSVLQALLVALLAGGGEIRTLAAQRVGEVQAVARVEQVADHEADRQGHGGHDEEVAEGQPADPADLGGGPDRADAQHDRAEDDRRDEHLDQPDERGAEPLQPDCELGEEQADADAQRDGGDDGEIEPVGAVATALRGRGPGHWC